MQKIIIVATIVATFSAGVATARAQTPKAEFAVGYAYLHDDGLDDGLPVGWMASAAGNLTSWFGVVGEVGGNYKSYESSPSVNVSVRVHSFLFGPRLSLTSRSPIAPFVQLLFGAVHGAVDVGAPNVNLIFSGTEFAYQPGIGLDLNTSPNFGLRFEADSRRINSDDGDHREWRLVGALVFRR